MMANEMNKTIDRLMYEDRMKILKFLISKKTKISKSGDGSRIMLDRLSEDTKKELDVLISELSVVSKENMF